MILCPFLVLILFSASCSPALSNTTPTATNQPNLVITIKTETNTPGPMIEPSAEPTLVPTTTPTSVPTPLPGEYIVKAGDSLSEISQIYGVSIGLIALKNGITDTNLIYPGQVISIPNPNEPLLETVETGKKIVVFLSEQKVYAFENGVLIADFLVSTGLDDTPTVQGSYYITTKLDSTNMSGPGYNLKDVPWTMYFYQGYSFHGTYWHSNFGQPMSHGCINMKTEEAKWLYDWSPIGTPVTIYP